MRQPNDVGGMAAGPINPNSGEPAPWQKLLTAMVTSLGPTRSRIIRIDEFRRAREDIPAEIYNGLTYFEIWTQGIANLLIEKGVVTGDEIRSRMSAIKGRES